MERKQKIILGIFISIILILIVIFVLVLSSNIKKEAKTSSNKGEESKPVEVVSQPITEQQSDLNEIINTARGFVEIYFTYSNSSNFSNFTEVYPFMTDNFKANVDKLISLSNGSNKNSNYYLKTTTVTNVTMNNKYDKQNTNAVLSVSALEKNVDANEKETINEKKYNVYMIKTDKWRVDDIKIKVNNVEKSIFDSNL